MTKQADPIKPAKAKKSSKNISGTLRLPVFSNEHYDAMASHIQTCQEPSCLYKHFLVQAFNPMIVKIALAFRYRWPHEFSELFTLVRARFIRNLYKYEVGGPYYFRFFMRKAVWFDVRDVVFKERRQMGLQAWTDKVPVHQTTDSGEDREVSLGYWIRPDNPADEMSDQIDLSNAIEWLQGTKEVSETDKGAFQLITSGYSPQQALAALGTPPQYSVMAATLRVRSALCRHLTGSPLFLGWIAAAKCEATALTRMGIKIGPYNGTPKEPALPRFERCEATDEALSRLQAFDHRYLWHFEPIQSAPDQRSGDETVITPSWFYIVEFDDHGDNILTIRSGFESKANAVKRLPKGADRDHYDIASGQFLIDRGIRYVSGS